MDFQNKMFLSFSDQWHLRAEGGHGILFYYDPDSSIWHLLDREHVCAILLMDGSRTSNEISRILDYLFECPLKGKMIVESLISASNSDQNPVPFLIERDSIQRINDLSILKLKNFLNRMEQATREEFNQVRNGRLTSPLNLTLLPSNECTTNCIYCYAERKHIPSEELLTPQRWFELIDEAAELNIELAVFSGGDPLTYPHIISILEHMIVKGFKFVLPTKTLIKKEMAKQLAEIGADNSWIQISIDAVLDDTLFKLVGVEGYRDRAFESIKNLLNFGLKVRVNCVATQNNYKEIPELIMELHKIGVAHVAVAGYGRSHYRHRDELFLSNDQMNWLNEEVSKIKAEFDWKNLRCNLGTRDFRSVSKDNRAIEWKNRARCSGGRSCITITPSGKVTLCEQIPQSDEYIVGDLKYQSISEVWNSDKMKSMIFPSRESFKGTACQNCNEFDECKNIYGFCFRDALFTFGTIFAPPPACPYAPQGLRMA